MKTIEPVSTYTMPLGDSSFQTRVRKETTKRERDMPSKRRLSSIGGDVGSEDLVFLEDFLEALGDSVAALVASGAVSGGGVSGADSPSPCNVP